METINGTTMHAYRGDNGNCFEADAEKREPKPEKLLDGYHHSSMTLNYLRALMTGGFADLHHPENWQLEFLNRSPQKKRYEEMVVNIKEAIGFMESLGSYQKELESVDFYTSHEGLLLGYEEAMTRYVPEQGQYYNLSAHMLWIGDRTRQLNGGHVEYFRGVANPVGLKVGPQADPREIIEIAKSLNPKNQTGKIILISRLGSDKVNHLLPDVIKAVQDSKLNVVWSVDPMHGNGILTKDKIKTRDFDSIQSEIQSSFKAHHQQGSVLGGVHFELAGGQVTECLGGSEGVCEADLDKNYETFCDPRLNNSQSLELAFSIASLLQAQNIENMGI
jgi:3-deoxy-7-phosphoheptulonate synthase